MLFTLFIFYAIYSVSGKDEKVLLGATIDLLRIMYELRLTEREIALLNAVVLFQPGRYPHYCYIQQFSQSIGRITSNRAGCRSDYFLAIILV